MLDWIFPQVIEIKNNKKVVKDKGKFIVYVDNTEQSGPWVKKIWSNIPLLGDNILILGLGAGSIIPLLESKSKITGVELDPEMVEIGKKYFNLPDTINIVIGDAGKFVMLNKEKFDLILVDLYQGKKFPIIFESPLFLEKLSQTISKDGVVIFNRLTTKNANFEPNKFIDKLEKYFKIQLTRRIDFNTLFICSRREKH